MAHLQRKHFFGVIGLSIKLNKMVEELHTSIIKLKEWEYLYQNEEDKLVDSIPALNTLSHQLEIMGRDTDHTVKELKELVTKLYQEGNHGATL